jgi:hypothetical protein
MKKKLTLRKPTKESISKIGMNLIPHPKSSSKKTPFLLRYSRSIGKVRR